MNKNVFLLAVLLPTIASRAEVYFIPDLKANWFEAQEVCQSMDANLVTIPNSTANDAVVKSILNYTSNTLTIFWIGANDWAKPGTLKWIANGQMAMFIPWGTGEPNNAGGSEHCVNMQSYPKDGGLVWGWNDDGCYKRFKFVCEKEVRCVKEF